MIDQNIDVDFYFGDKFGDVEKLDYKALRNVTKEVANKAILPPFYWQSGVVCLFFKKYNRYIILGEYYCLSTWLLLILCKLSRKKIYIWTHGWYGNETFLKRFVKKIFYHLGDGVLLYGNYAKRLMIKEGFDTNKLHVIYNSLDYEAQIQVREKLKPSLIYQDYFQNNYPVMIFIGRLTLSKKLNLLIEAQRVLKNKNFNVNLVFVGSGLESDNLKELVVKYELQNYVWFYGPTYNEEQIGELIYNADLCVSPGNVGLTAMHCMVYGTPVITHSDFTSQKPEFEAIVERETGMFFIKDDIANLSKAIHEWLITYKDRDQIRSNCFNKIAFFYNPKIQFDILARIF
jgi:glycosyltransferase involved in cell wall biosynthesis